VYKRQAQSQQRVDAWWDGLNELDQKNPVNIAKHNAANTALTRAGQFLGSASQAVTNASNATVQYSLNKKPKNLWNFLIGSQFQINRSLMIRAEVGFLASRTQFIGGIQYRFNL
jgi:hypothetical protein